MSDSTILSSTRALDAAFTWSRRCNNSAMTIVMLITVVDLPPRPGQLHFGPTSVDISCLSL